MGYSRRVRFTAPADPRTVWTAVLAVIGAGAGYPTERYAPGRPVTELFGGANGCWRGTAESGGYHTDTVLAVPTMYYGADGGPLVDDDGADGPGAYVEVMFDTAYSRADAAILATDRLAAALGVPAQWADDYCDWQPIVQAAK